MPFLAANQLIKALECREWRKVNMNEGYNPGMFLGLQSVNNYYNFSRFYISINGMNLYPSI